MIYFIQRPDGGRIKIGTTFRLSERLRELAKEAGCELRVLAVVDGGHDVERTLHGRFAHLRVVNEWFEPGDDLLGFIVTEGREWSDDGRLRLGSVKLPIDVIETARIVSAYRNESMTEMLGDLLRPILARMEQDEVARRTKEGKKGR